MSHIENIVDKFDVNILTYCCNKIRESTEKKLNTSKIRKIFYDIAQELRELIKLSDFSEKTKKFSRILEKKEHNILSNYINHLKFINEISSGKITYPNNENIFKILKKTSKTFSIFSKDPSFEEDEREANTLQIKGFIIGTSDILNNKTKAEPFETISIFSLNSFLIDANLKMSKNINILSPYWWMADKKEIDLSGSNGEENKNGGDNGENAGYFYEKGKDFCWPNEKLLTIKANGGKGRDGDDTYRKIQEREKGNFITILDIRHGMPAGKGGNAGRIEIVDVKNIPQENYTAIIQKGEDGEDRVTPKIQTKLKINYGLTKKALDVQGIGRILVVPAAIFNTICLPFNAIYCLAKSKIVKIYKDKESGKNSIISNNNVNNNRNDLS